MKKKKKGDLRSNGSFSDAQCAMAATSVKASVDFQEHMPSGLMRIQCHLKYSSVHRLHRQLRNLKELCISAHLLRKYSPDVKSTRTIYHVLLQDPQTSKAISVRIWEILEVTPHPTNFIFSNSPPSSLLSFIIFLHFLWWIG